MKLFLFTSKFPFGSGEEFLENEIPFLEKHFQVWIIPMEAGGLPTRETRRAQINKEFAETQRRGKIKRLLSSGIRMFGSGEDLKKILGNPGRVKSYLGARSNAIELSKWFIKMRFVEKSERFVLYSYWLNSSALALTKIRKEFPNCLAVARAHRGDLYQERVDNRRKYNPFRAFSIKGLDALFLISKHGLDYLSGVYPKEKGKMFLSRLGVSSGGKQIPTNGSKKVLVSCSAITSVKRVDLIVKALALLGKEQPFIWYHFGSGPLEKEIKQLAHQKLPDDSFVFFGHQTNQKVLDFYRKNWIDFFISTSSSEGLPVSMMEAASFGIPILGTNVGGVPEICSPTTGSLLPENPTPEEICEALLIEFQLPEESRDQKRNSVKKLQEERFNAEKNYLGFAKKLIELSVISN